MWFTDACSSLDVCWMKYWLAHTKELLQSKHHLLNFNISWQPATLQAHLYLSCYIIRAITWNRFTHAYSRTVLFWRDEKEGRTSSQIMSFNSTAWNDLAVAKGQTNPRLPYRQHCDCSAGGGWQSSAGIERVEKRRDRPQRVQLVQKVHWAGWVFTLQWRKRTNEPFFQRDLQLARIQHRIQPPFFSIARIGLGFKRLNCEAELAWFGSHPELRPYRSHSPSTPAAIWGHYLHNRDVERVLSR